METRNHFTPQLLTSNFHTTSSENLLSEFLAGALTYADYIEQTLCIMLQVSIRNQEVFSCPIVLPVAVTATQLKVDLEMMKGELKRMFEGRIDKYASTPKVEAQWNHEAAGMMMRPTAVAEGNAGVLLRYLKQRGGVDTIVVSF